MQQFRCEEDQQGGDAIRPIQRDQYIKSQDGEAGNRGPRTSGLWRRTQPIAYCNPCIINYLRNVTKS